LDNKVNDIIDARCNHEDCVPYSHIPLNASVLYTATYNLLLNSSMWSTRHQKLTTYTSES